MRFRKDHRLDLGGCRVRPDIVFTRWKVAVFVDGCFWHACPVHFVAPKTNPWYWEPKLQRNRERDALANGALANSGWRVVRIWEHQSITEAVEAVVAAVRLSSAEPAAHMRRRSSTLAASTAEDPRGVG